MSLHKVIRQWVLDQKKEHGIEGSVALMVEQGAYNDEGYENIVQAILFPRGDYWWHEDWGTYMRRNGDSFEEEAADGVEDSELTIQERNYYNALYAHQDIIAQCYPDEKWVILE